MHTVKTSDLPHYGIDDYLSWEGEWELIHGIPYAMTPAPIKRHQVLVLAIASELLTAMDDCPLCSVLIDEDWRLDDHTILRPDVSVVCNDDNPNYISRPPEVIFEVINPATAKRDEGLKFELYQEQGVKYYVLADPASCKAKVFRHDGERFILALECDDRQVEFNAVTCPFALDFDTVFRRLKK